MKVPNVFLPEKNLESAAELLKHTKNKNINSLNELILNEDANFPEFIYYEKLGIKESHTYRLLRESDISDGVFVDYGDPCVSIIEFKNKNFLIENIGVIRSIVKEFNDNKDISHKSYALLKEKYAIFVYADLKDPIRNRLVNAYKRIGFKEPRGEHENT